MSEEQGEVKNIREIRNYGKFHFSATIAFLLKLLPGDCSLCTQIKKSVRNFITFAEAEDIPSCLSCVFSLSKYMIFTLKEKEMRYK